MVTGIVIVYEEVALIISGAVDKILSYFSKIETSILNRHKEDAYL